MSGTPFKLGVSRRNAPSLPQGRHPELDSPEEFLCILFGLARTDLEPCPFCVLPTGPWNQSLSRSTDRVCRLPLPTSFYRIFTLDVINTVSVGFSKAGGGAPDIERAALLYVHNVPISGASRFQGVCRWPIGCLGNDRFFPLYSP